MPPCAGCIGGGNRFGSNTKAVCKCCAEIEKYEGEKYCVWDKLYRAYFCFDCLTNTARKTMAGLRTYTEDE